MSKFSLDMMVSATCVLLHPLRVLLTTPMPQCHVKLEWGEMVTECAENVRRDRMGNLSRAVPGRVRVHGGICVLTPDESKMDCVLW